jgi:hypothetical protein
MLAGCIFNQPNSWPFFRVIHLDVTLLALISMFKDAASATEIRLFPYPQHAVE